MADIPSARRWLSVEQIQKGWSDDRKYRIVTDSGETRLLRLSDGSKEAAKRREFEVMRRAAETGIAMSHPLECWPVRRGCVVLHPPDLDGRRGCREDSSRHERERAMEFRRTSRPDARRATHRFRCRGFPGRAAGLAGGTGGQTPLVAGAV